MLFLVLVPASSCKAAAAAAAAAALSWTGHWLGAEPVDWACAHHNGDRLHAYAEHIITTMSKALAMFC
jgi:hypothetical protein